MRGREFMRFTGCGANPQTSGGLLASIPSANAEACLKDLHIWGYQDSCSIGEVSSSTSVFIELI